MDMSDASWVPHYGDPGQLRDSLLEEAHSLSCYYRARLREPRHVSTRMRKAHGKPARHRVSCRCEHNGDRPSRLPRSGRRIISRREDDIDAKAHQLTRQVRQSFVPLLRPSPLNSDGLAFNITKLAETSCQRLKQIRKARIGEVGWMTASQIADLRKFSATLRRGTTYRLRLSGERRGEHGSQASDEGAAVHRLALTLAMRRDSAAGSLRWLVEDLSDGLEQLPHADGLALKAVEARGHDPFLVMGHYRR